MGDGTPFGRYRLLELLGEGGMGQVHLARDTETDRLVALKVLRAEFAADHGFNERFRREAYAAAGLHEPHVVPIHNFGEIDGRLYVDMRLIEGRDLGVLIRESVRGMDPHRAVAIIEQIASALEAAHRAGLVHRDVKPSNILVGERDFAYLIDFGIVRATESSSLTATGMTLGTVAYMAPEQFMTGQVDARSDIYSLACVLFEAVTGRQPFTGDWRQIGMAHASAPPPSASSINPAVPPHLDAVIAAAMAKDPANRYQSASAFGQAAREALTSPQNTALWQPQQWQPTNPIVAQSGFTPQVRGPWWRRKGVVIGAAGALVAVLVGSVVFAVLPDESSDASARETPSSAGEPQASESEYGRVTTLPFATLGGLPSLAVGPGGTVYVGTFGRLMKLAPGGPSPEILSFADLFSALAISVDRRGDVYMADNTKNRVAILRAGETTPEDLPFGPVSAPFGIAVNATSTAYLADSANNRVLKLAPGASAPDVVSAVEYPYYVAVDSHNTVYAATTTNIVKISADGSPPEQVGGAPDFPGGVAVDADDNLYATSKTDNRVSKLDVASDVWEELPFTGLVGPGPVAVDERGNVFVIDEGKRVVKLPKN